jgi:hypothetical protein
MAAQDKNGDPSKKNEAKKDQTVKKGDGGTNQNGTHGGRHRRDQD